MNDLKLANRVLVSMMTVASFFLMTASGIVAYVVPHGRIAYWTDWSFLGLSKTNWADIHISGSLFFVVACVFSPFLQLETFDRLFREQKQRRSKPQKGNLSTTFAVLGLLIISSIYRIPPLSYALGLE